jgi:hypothetical protein
MNFFPLNVFKPSTQPLQQYYRTEVSLSQTPCYNVQVSIGTPYPFYVKMSLSFHPHLSNCGWENWPKYFFGWFLSFIYFSFLVLAQTTRGKQRYRLTEEGAQNLPLLVRDY